jgi:hypothetical protein
VRAASVGKEVGSHAVASQTDERRRQDDDRKRHKACEDRQERDRGNRHQQAILEHAFADAQHGFGDDGHHGGFEAEEQPRHKPHLLVLGVHNAEGQNRDAAR